VDDCALEFNSGALLVSLWLDMDQGVERKEAIGFASLRG
jgi:hypothetical protein